MNAIARNLFRALGRVFPDCVTLCQAIAFNMFLAFFPLLLLALGVLAKTSLFHDALREIPERLNLIVPPGSADVVTAYFVRKTAQPGHWIALGLGGTLAAGTQVMVGYMEGFRVIEGDLLRASYWRRQFRALALLCVTLVPMLAVSIFTVFGKPIRAWLLARTGSALLTRTLDLAFYGAVVFLLVVVTLASIASAESTDECFDE